MSFNFSITKTSQYSKARLGVINTPNGVVETPAFIFCGTKGAIKGLTPQQMREAGTQIILANTYHLMLQPGPKIISHHGGLAKFNGWKGPTLTDSGGFQIFSLGHGGVANEIKGSNRPNNTSLIRINERGAVFRSYIDGSIHELTPEKSIQVQRGIGADMILVLDECTPFHVSYDYTARSMNMSHRWALRSLTEFQRLNTDGRQALYGIIQGGIHQTLRDESIDFVNDQPFFGHAIGGSLGKDKSQMHEIVEYTSSRLAPGRPIHLLGIGGISDIFNGVKAGIDTFDCVHPTRIARHGGALVQRSKYDHAIKKDHININNAQFKDDNSAIESHCQCYSCKNFTRSYIHHLFKAKEMLGMNLLTIHNVFFMNRLLREIRQAIVDDTLDCLEKSWLV